MAENGIKNMQSNTNCFSLPRKQTKFVRYTICTILINQINLYRWERVNLIYGTWSKTSLLQPTLLSTSY